MFYCRLCQKRNNYPETIFISYGTCEICDEVGECHEAHHDIINAIDMMKLKIMLGMI